MSSEDVPVRLVDRASDAPEGLRALVRQAREDVGTPEEVRGVAAALGPLLGPPGSPPGAPSGTEPGGGPLPGLGEGAAGGSLTAAGKVSAVLTAGAMAAGVAFWQGAEHRSQGPPPTLPSEQVRVDVQPSGEAEAEESAGVEPVVEPEGSRAIPEADAPVPAPPGSSPGPRRTDPRPAAPASPPPVDPSAERHDAPSEADLLGRAQAALKTDPARAMALVHEHSRRFPNGGLAQEREVIAVEALARLGRLSEAEQRADGFKERYRGSMHQRKVGEALKVSRGE